MYWDKRCGYFNVIITLMHEDFFLFKQMWGRFMFFINDKVWHLMKHENQGSKKLNSTMTTKMTSSNRIRAGDRFFVNFVKGREDTLRDNEYDSQCNLTATVESLGVLVLQYNSLFFL